MKIDIHPFEYFLATLADITGLIFEVRDTGHLVFSTRSEGMLRPDLAIEIEALMSLITDRCSFQRFMTQTGDIIAGLPLQVNGKIVGALIIYHESDGNDLSLQSGADALPSWMEKLLISICGIMEDKWNAHEESNEMAQELDQYMEDIYLYSRISTQIDSLSVSGTMLKSLIEELLETMRVDIAFSLFPDWKDCSALTCTAVNPVKKTELPSFVKDLIDNIPDDAHSLKEGYFILNDSRLVSEYRSLHRDPFRFLAVVIKNDQKFFGWIGLVSFNMNEIFRRGELRLLKSLAKSTAVALENTRLYKDSILMANKERSIRNIFQKYVPAAVANEILDRGERDLIHLGEKRRVTLLNVDIRGYSAMSKKFSAEDIVAILNHFFMVMGSVIIKHNGILDKYLGDGILAVFGAPVASENHALDATLAAIDMIDQRQIVEEFANKRFGIPINIGISIHTGDVILGNIGFDRKMEYTVIGDVVNDTFRLQELTRKKNNSILISSITQREVSPYVTTCNLGFRSLRINESEMEVYEVIGAT